MTLKVFKSSHRAAVPETPSDEHRHASSKGAFSTHFSGLGGLRGKKSTQISPEAAETEGRSSGKSVKSYVASSFKSTMKIAGNGLMDGMVLAAQGTTIASKSTYKGLKKATKWLDKQLQSPPSTHSHRPRSEEEDYYGTHGSSSGSNGHSEPSYRTSYRAPTEQRHPEPTQQFVSRHRAEGDVYRQRERPMTPSERRDAEQAAAYHGTTVASYYVTETEVLKNPFKAPAQASRQSAAQLKAREEAEKAAHQEALDNGY